MQKFTAMLIVSALCYFSSVSARADCQLGACVGVGAELASIDSSDGALLNLLAQLLLKSNVAVNVSNWEGVAQTDLNLLTLLQAIRIQTGAASTSEALTSSISLANLLNASVTALQNEGDLVGANAVGLLSTSLSGIPDMNNTIQLGNLLTLAGTQDALLDLEFNVLHLFFGSLQLFNSENTLGTPSAVTITTASLLSALGLDSLASSVQLSLRITEPPQYKCGDAGIVASSATTRLKLDLDLINGFDFSTNLLAADVDASLAQISVYLELSPATAELTSLTPSSESNASISLDATHGIARLFVGEFDDSEFFDPNYSPAIDNSIYDDLDPANIGQLTLTLGLASASADLSIRSYAHGTQNTTGLVFTTFPSTKSLDSSVAVIGSLVSDTLSNLEITIDGGGLTAILATLGVPLSQLATTITTPLSAMLDNQILSPLLTTTIDTLLEHLGVSIGKVIVFLSGFAGACDVNGQVYQDNNPADLLKSAGEDWTLGATIWVHAIRGGQLHSSFRILPGTGDFSFSGLPLGDYTFILAKDAGVLNVAIPDGWEAATPNTGSIAMTLVSRIVSDLEFGLRYLRLTIGGTVFLDSGLGAGTANDGIRNGSETAIANRKIRLFQNGDAIPIASADTGIDGSYRLDIDPAWLNQALDLSIDNEANQLLININPGTSGGNYQANSGRLSFSPSSSTIENVAIAIVPVSTLSADIELTAGPGQLVLIPHKFNSGSAGSLAVTVSAENALPTGWSASTIRDADCDGSLDNGESIVVSSLAVTHDTQICVLNKVFIARTASAKEVVNFKVNAVYTLNGSLVENFSSRGIIIVSEQYKGLLQLTKEVDKVSALPGETIVYTIHYKNVGAEAISNLIIYDHTPTFTTFVSNDCNSQLGHGLNSCSASLPNSGTNGGLTWQFTPSLSGGGSGRLNFTVQVDSP